MMKIFIKTKVNCDLDYIVKHFDQDLFQKLTPPLVKLNIKRFDGCKKNDEIHLEMNILGKKSPWTSVITTDALNEQEFYFIDEGRDIPFPLTYWKHSHSVKKIADNECFIIDEIHYEAKNSFLANFIYPILYAMFYARVPIYQKEFNK